MAFASGKDAWGISDRSGFRYRLKDMMLEWNGALVGPDEYEPKHPQLFPPRIGPDPPNNLVSTGSVGVVTVTT